MCARDFVIARDRRDLRGDDKAARRDEYKHHVQQIEDRRFQHFARRVVAASLADALRRRRDLAAFRRAQDACKQQNDDALAEAEPQEGRLIAMRLDRGDDRINGERGAGTETRGSQAGGKAAAIGEPFERIADAGAVDRARADAGKDRPG